MKDPGKTVKCFYHSADHDGRLSGSIVKSAYLKKVDLYGIDYGQKFPWDEIKPGNHVVMVDFCLEPFSDMIKLYNLITSDGTGRFIWCDHHQSSMDAFNKALSNGEIESKYNLWTISAGTTEGAACEKIWRYYFKEQPVPRFVQLVSWYDTWQHHMDLNILPFHYGLLTFDTDPKTSQIWERLGNTSEVDYIINSGKTILEYINRDNRAYAQATIFETKLDGYSALAINRGLTNSKIFDSIQEAMDFDIQILFSWAKTKWKVSLFSIGHHADVSKIAVKHGGGGHPGASGFHCDKLPFKLKN